MYVFLRFFTFFQNPKKHDFLRFFELLHTFSRTVPNTFRIRLTRMIVYINNRPNVLWHHSSVTCAVCSLQPCVVHISFTIYTAALASCGTVYCNQSCLCVWVWVFVCMWLCYHDNSKLRASILAKLDL